MKRTLYTLLATTLCSTIHLFGLDKDATRFDKDARLLHVVAGSSKVSILVFDTTTVAAVKERAVTLAAMLPKSKRKVVARDTKVVLSGIEVVLEDGKTCAHYGLLHNATLSYAK